MKKRANFLDPCVIVQSAVPSENKVSAIINRSRYFHLTSNCWSIHYYGERLYVHTFGMVDTAFSYMEEY